MRINLNNLAIDYSDNGSGIPLFLIHGYPLSRALWEPQTAGLADVARVLALDLRGHGGSDPGPGPYSMSVLADDCRGFLDALGIARPVVLGGLSMGGYVAFEFYRKYPQRIAGLILAATRAGADSIAIRRLRQPERRVSAQSSRRCCRKYFPKDPFRPGRSW